MGLFSPYRFQEAGEVVIILSEFIRICLCSSQNQFGQKLDSCEGLIIDWKRTGCKPVHLFILLFIYFCLIIMAEKH